MKLGKISGFPPTHPLHRSFTWAAMSIGQGNIWHMTDTPSVLLCVFTNHINALW